MARTRTPDKLDRESKMATDAGMSYGKWKALQPIIYVEESPDPRERLCLHCGSPFISFRNKKYCDSYCQQRASTLRGNQRDMERRAATREQAQNDRY